MSPIIIRKHPTVDIYCMSDGRVIRKASGVHGAKITKGTIAGGYFKVHVAGKAYSVHRLIAETFIENPENKGTVDHINRDRMDNRVENLRWANVKEQAKNRDFVINRSDLGVREKDNLAEYTRVRRAFVRVTGHGLGRPEPKMDPFHQKHREYCAKYRARHPDRIKAQGQNLYKSRRKSNVSVH